MSDSPGKVVFLSYASQDAAAAKRICEALRSAGVEVWFDVEGGLETGDEWDAKIRRQIKECVLFIPIISANTQARHEGYFRIEWDLAAERARGIASGVPFILPVVIDDVREGDALVPDRFRMVQWTRLNGGDVSLEVRQRLVRLWSHRTGVLKHEAARVDAETAPVVARGKSRLSPVILAGLGALLFLGAGGAWWTTRRSPVPAGPGAAATPAVVNVPGTMPLSEARQLADRAFAMSVDSYDSTLDDYTAAEGLMKRALTLEANDGEILARSAQLQLMFRNRGFDFAPTRLAVGCEQAERAVRLVPDSPEALVALSLAQRYTGNRDGQLETLKRAVARAPDHARALLALGAVLTFPGRDLDEGLELYRRASKQPKWAPLAHYYEFLRFWAERRFPEAERAARHSYAATASANSLGALAMLHLTWKGDLDEAARELAGCPAKLFNTPRVVWLTAQVQLNHRSPDEALRALDRLPDDFIRDSWFVGPKALLVGRAHALAGRMSAAHLAWEAGLGVIDARLKAEPGDPTLRRARGELLAWLGRTDEALQEARTVDEIRRGQLDSWNFSVVTIYAALGRADLAAGMLEKQLAAQSNWPLTVTLLKQDPLWDKVRGDPAFQQLVGKAAARELVAAPPRDWPKNPELKKATTLLDKLDSIPEDFRLAEEIVQQVLEKNPTDPEVVTAMARVHSMWLLRGWDRSTARYQKAKATAERALQLAPDEPEAHVALAIHLYARGAEPQRAIDLAQRAVDLCPQEPRFHRIRDNCLWVLHVPTGSVFLDKGVDALNDGLKSALSAAQRTVELFPRDALVRYELSRHYRDIGRWADFERVNDETLALAPVANALVWKARARFGLHGDLPGMRAVLDQVPGRVRGIERTVFGYFLYAAFTGNTADGLDALNALTDPWMIDFDFRGPKAQLAGALLGLAGKKELARVQYETALTELQRSRSLNPEDSQTYLNEAWIKHALGRTDEARAALRIYNETLSRPFAVLPISTWWFQAIPANLLMGDRATGLTLMREACTSSKEGRATLGSRLALDPRLASFREDPEIKAILAGPARQP